MAYLALPHHMRRLYIIVTGFAISFVAVSFLAFMSISRFSELNAYTDNVNHAYKVQEKLNELDGDIRNIDRYERGYMLTRDTIHLRHKVENEKGIAATLDSLKRLFGDNKTAQQNLTLLRSSLTLRLDAARKNIAFCDTNQIPGKLSPYYAEGRDRMLECRRYVDTMRLQQNRVIQRRQETRAFYQQLTGDYVTYITIALGIISLMLFGLMVHEVRRRIRYQRELQEKLAEVNRSHSELQEIAYAASHDLQEPLRKIRVFADRIQLLEKDGPLQDNSEVISSLQRIEHSANRMQSLVTDLMNLTSLVTEKATTANIPLQSVARDAWQSLEEKVNSRKATITIEQLPVVTGNREQLFILFTSLLDNALKFCREDVPSRILIRCEKVLTEVPVTISSNEKQEKAEFYKISVQDNGIGFDNQFAAEMFRIFRRLHNEEAGFGGGGIGLAICQRIMVNHKGYITGHGKLGEGAAFHLYFPVKHS